MNRSQDESGGAGPSETGPLKTEWRRWLWWTPLLLIATGAVASWVAAGGVWPQAGGIGAGRGPRLTDGGRPFDLSNLRVDEQAIRHGGPPKDGIPALTTAAARPAGQRDPRLHGASPPRFVRAENADFLAPQSRVAGVTVGGQSRAYPLAVLNYHEVINDVVGGVPIAVIYCPLCDSVSVVDRRLDGRVYEFGISGKLYNSNVLMYDRTDHALWSQVKLEAISGPNAGRSLRHLDGWELVTLETWRKDHPKSEVLSFDTGYLRRYERNPYEGYFTNDRIWFPVHGEDGRLAAKRRVIGIRYDGVTRAYPVETIHELGRVEDDLGGSAVVIESLGHRRGVRVAQAPEGAEVVHTFWFAWAAFWPQTSVFEPPAAGE